MLILGVAAAAACVVTLMLWKAPAASGQEETSPTEPSFLVKCEFHHRDQVDPIVDFGNPKSHHMHEFFGNTTTNAKSPNVDVNPHPALDTNGDGQLDDGLKIVTVQGKNVEWRCFNGTWSTTAPTQCSNGKLVVRVKFPDCLALARDPATGQPIPGKPMLDTDPASPTTTARIWSMPSRRPTAERRRARPATHTPYRGSKRTSNSPSQPLVASRSSLRARTPPCTPTSSTPGTSRGLMSWCDSASTRLRSRLRIRRTHSAARQRSRGRTKRSPRTLG